MKKIFVMLILAIAVFTGCTGKSDTEKASEAIETTRDNVVGSWTNDDGELYSFSDKYVFSGKIMVDGALKEVSGDYNLVSVDGSDTALTINTPDIRVTYYVDIHNDKIVFLDTDTKEEVKTLRLAE